VEKNNVRKVILKNVASNHIITSLDIQKEFANSCLEETVKAILEELGN